METTEKRNSFLYFSVASVNLGMIALGATATWTSPALPKLTGSLTISQCTWIASLLPLAAAFSPFAAGFLSDSVGRKKTLLVSILPIIVGYVIKGFATEVIYFYVARILCGVGSGAFMAVLPIYIAEIAENRNRGTLGCFMACFMTAGNITSYAIGPYVSLMWLSWASLIAPAFFLVLFGLVVPESPHYLVASNKAKEAEISLRKLRTNNDQNDELLEITKSIEDSASDNAGIIDLIKTKSVLRALVITLGLVIFQQFSGINVIMFYTQSIFEATGSKISPEISALVTGIVQFLACILASTIVDKLGRRFLLLLSAVGEILSLTCLGFYFYLKEQNPNVDYMYWLPIVTLITFVISFGVGFGALPFMILGELFPPHVKSAASTITITTCLLSCFFTLKFFPMLMAIAGMAITFWLLAFFCFLSGCFVYFLMPETKGKSFQEIQDILTR